jgi:hypothetical protein
MRSSIQVQQAPRGPTGTRAAEGIVARSNCGGRQLTFGGAQSHRAQPLGQRLPARDRAHACPRVDAWKQPAQLDGSREFTTLLVGDAGCCGLCVADDHGQSMGDAGCPRQVLRADFSASARFPGRWPPSVDRHSDPQEFVSLQAVARNQHVQIPVSPGYDCGTAPINVVWRRHRT